MASAGLAKRSVLFCMLAACMLFSTAHAFKPLKIPASDIFYNPKGLTLYHVPSFEFGLPACGPRDDDFRFTVSYDAILKAPLFTVKYTPIDTSSLLQFQAFRTIQLNIKTGLLTLRSYGATITVDLKTYLPTDNLQASYLGGVKGRQVLGQEPVLVDAIASLPSAKLADLDPAVLEALRILSKTAKTFSVNLVSYHCREKTTVPGTPTFAPLAAWLTTLRTLPLRKL